MATVNKQTRLGNRNAGQGTGGETNKKSVIDRIRSIGFKDNDGIKMLLYGASGTGKTTLWATFPKPILCIVCSGGNKTGELRSIDTPEYRKTIKGVVIHSSAEVIELIDYAKGGDFATIVLDHASGLQDLTLKEILGLDEIPVVKNWGLASQQQYGQCTTQVKESLRGLLGLDSNVVVIAHEREFTTEGMTDIITPTIGAALVPSLTTWLNGAVDYIGQTFKRQKEVLKKTMVNKGKKDQKVITTREKTKDIEYCLRTSAADVYTTKFRLPKGTPLPDVIVDPDYNKIMAIIRAQNQSEVEETEE